MNRAHDRVHIWKNETILNTKEKQSLPGTLKYDKEWVDWESKLINYRSIIFGVNSVPLSYVIRENNNPSIAGSRIYDIFIDETIYCDPLTGTFYDTDKQSIHQKFLSFTTRQLLEDWIKLVARHNDGIRSMTDLRDDFSGEENATIHISRE